MWSRYFMYSTLLLVLSSIRRKPGYLHQSIQNSIQIYQRSIEGVDGNVIISPLSILTAISYLMLGASGRTLSQMKSSLKYGDIEDAKFKMNFLNLMAHFEGENLVKVENKIYDIENDSKKPNLHQVNTQIRLSKVDTINFVESDELHNALDDDTIVLLTNSLSFEDTWKHDFDRSTIYKGDFFKNGRDATEMEFLAVQEYFKFGEFKDLNATAVQLSFDHSNVTLMFLLPNSKTGLPALESKLHQINFGDLTQRMSKEKIQVIIPKFRLQYKRNMNDPLKKMGMERMFSDDAEFDNLLKSTDSLKVFKVLHKSVIQINAKAVKDAKVMEINDLEDCVSCAQKRFIADRPFLFAMIQESTVMYIGRKVQ